MRLRALLGSTALTPFYPEAHSAMKLRLAFEEFWRGFKVRPRAFNYGGEPFRL